ncbi:hypothetical protein HUT19_38845 [Streptomyces sp. NA02950]|uniref:hypothetical protein n=1 Tax=Streptomyces sp. NA02950 TaxID=2742137 RepID=UPI00158FFF41|nr:hypothetical protein [Streptomyces sp. NA02950]QKV96927.1 hypothetical protein HUT19_38845 [Streptomyces sp. NA02950]
MNGTRRKALFGVAGLVLGGGGLVAINVGANAGNSSSDRSAGGVVCPGVADRLGDIPQRAAAEVRRNLELMRRDIKAADTRLSSEKNVASRTVLDPLRSKRSAVLERIETAVERAGAERPKDLPSLATCTAGGTEVAKNATGGDGRQSPQQPPATGTPQPSDGPAPEDFVDITKAPPNVRQVSNGKAASGRLPRPVRCQRGGAERQPPLARRLRRCARCVPGGLPADSATRPAGHL